MKHEEAGKPKSKRYTALENFELQGTKFYKGSEYEFADKVAPSLLEDNLIELIENNQDA